MEEIDIAFIVRHFTAPANEPPAPRPIDAPVDGYFFPHYWKQLAPTLQPKS